MGRKKSQTSFSRFYIVRFLSILINYAYSFSFGVGLFQNQNLSFCFPHLWILALIWYSSDHKEIQSYKLQKPSPYCLFFQHPVIVTKLVGHIESKHPCNHYLDSTIDISLYSCIHFNHTANHPTFIYPVIFVIFKMYFWVNLRH